MARMAILLLELLLLLVRRDARLTHWMFACCRAVRREVGLRYRTG